MRGKDVVWALPVVFDLLIKVLASGQMVSVVTYLSTLHHLVVSVTCWLDVTLLLPERNKRIWVQLGY